MCLAVIYSVTFFMTKKLPIKYSQILFQYYQKFDVLIMSKRSPLECISMTLNAAINLLMACAVIFGQARESISGEFQRQKFIESFKSVRIFGGDIYGSGVLVRLTRQGYALIVTADHVLKNTRANICVENIDGLVYPAIILKRGGDELDLALLEIRVKVRQESYEVKTNNFLRQARFVYATGFSANGSYKYSRGELLTLLTKPLMGGYDTIYSSPIEKGMSGGGVFDSNGKLIAINSLHPEPLWDASLIYSDGSSVPPKMERYIGSHSAGISAKRVKRFILNIHPIPFEFKTMHCRK